MDGSFVVKGNIIWSESLSSIKSMEDIFLVVEEGKVKGVFKTLPSQYSSLSISSKLPVTVEYEVADYREYYYKRAKRDQNARATYVSQKKNLQQLVDDIFVLDIMRKDMKHDDPRLQSVISE